MFLFLKLKGYQAVTIVFSCNKHAYQFSKKSFAHLRDTFHVLILSNMFSFFEDLAKSPRIHGSYFICSFVILWSGFTTSNPLIRFLASSDTSAHAGASKLYFPVFIISNNSNWLSSKKG